MLKVCRIALVTVALLSTILFVGPVQAGMVETPKATPASKADVEVAILKSAAERAGMDGARVAAAASLMSVEARATAVAHVMATENAGNALGIVAICAGVVAVGVVVLSEMLWGHSWLTSYAP
ncbi:MAG: hypothetical protein IT452_14170 [Planctomycetia bacterium]|nr:hypothetical protein [Planctomycetia bacterium]